MKKTSYDVLKYMQDNKGSQLTATIIADALGTNVKSVNGIVTMSLCRHKDANKNDQPLAERLDEKIKISYTDDEGNEKEKEEKLIVLTPAGETFVPDEITE